jgi:uncharacterized OB-fold protein
MRRDLPTIDDETRPWWDAARQERFLIARCTACGAAHHYPRPFCPSCWSEEVTWEDASGRATLYTWSTVFVNDAPPFSDRLPYVAAVVDLAEGPRVMTNVVGCAPEDLRVGMELQVTYVEATPEITIPVWTPVG